MKRSKEMDNIAKAIHKWCRKYKGEVSFVGCFVAFDENSDITDNMLIGFGKKAVIKEHIAELNRQLKKSKEFVNW